MALPEVRARETFLEFSGARGHAVIVEFGKPWRFAFWSQAQYAGAVQLSERVMFTPQWCEENSPNDNECYEPMMDKQLRYASIELLETGPARVRVRWRYALSDIQYRVFHGDSHAEELWTVYPDGRAVREIALWPGTLSNHGGNTNFWQVHEWYLINAKGSTPTEVLRADAAFTMSDGHGRSFTLPWPLPTEAGEPLCKRYSEVADWENYIGTINLTVDPSPYAIICKSQRLFPFTPCCACHGNHPYFNLFRGLDPESETGVHNTYVHWPISKREDFIGWVSARGEVGTVATHTCFIDCNYAMRKSPRDVVETPAPGTTWYVIVGALAPGDNGEGLDAVAVSYRNPGVVELGTDDGEYEGFDYSARAHVICLSASAADRADLELRLLPVPAAPVIDPVFSVSGWTAPVEHLELSVDGTVIEANGFRAQTSGHDLVVWLRGRYRTPAAIRLVVRGATAWNSNVSG